MPGICGQLNAQYAAYMAQTPPDIYHAAQVWDQLKELGCPGLPDDPDPENQSGGHGGHLPGGG